MASPLRDISNQIEKSDSDDDPRKKLDVLEQSKKSDIISEEEFNKGKERLQPEIEEFDAKLASNQPMPESIEEPKKSSERNLVISIIMVILIFAAVFASFSYFKQEPKTIEDLHIDNLNGKLDPSLGYVYEGAYSFIYYDGQWFTQLASPKGTKQYGIAMRYSPRDLENISINGGLDKDFFDGQTVYYITFNPLLDNQQFTALAVADLNTHLTKIYEKMPIAACDRNETLSCATRPIITCSDKDKLVFYFKDSENSNVIYNGTCITIEGSGFDLVRGVDRVLYNMYGIMGQE